MREADYNIDRFIRLMTHGFEINMEIMIIRENNKLSNSIPYKSKYCFVRSCVYLRLHENTIITMGWTKKCLKTTNIIELMAVNLDLLFCLWDNLSSLSLSLSVQFCHGYVLCIVRAKSERLVLWKCRNSRKKWVCMCLCWQSRWWSLWLDNYLGVV